jgi:pathogenesis-related protein 1
LRSRRNCGSLAPMPRPCNRPAYVLLALVGAAGCAGSSSGVDGGSGSSKSSTPAAGGPAQPARERPVSPRPSAGEPPALAGITEAHNRVRARVGVAPLRWSPALAETARRWANSCVDTQAPRGMLDHSPDGVPSSVPVGENIYATTGPAADPLVAVKVWADEVVHYDLTRNTCSGGMCGHYTQLVWSTTQEVGCGVGSCPSLRFRTTLVCNYLPAGNVIGRRPYP